MDTTTIIGVLISFAVGFALKRWPAFNSKFIPIVNFVIGILTQIVNAAGSQGGNIGHPTSMAHGAAVLAVGSIFALPFVKVLLNALLQALITTGTYSGVKNVVQGFQGQKS